MPRIVDGDNVLGTWPGRRRSAAERRALAHEAARLARREGWRVVVVFDGPPPPGTLGPDVRFSGPGRNADQLILDTLRQQQDVRGWVVVTDDRSLADQCRYLGARVERCARFRDRLTRAGPGEKPERIDDLRYWIEVFGEDGEGPGS